MEEKKINFKAILGERVIHFSEPESLFVSDLYLKVENLLGINTSKFVLCLRDPDETLPQSNRTLLSYNIEEGETLQIVHTVSNVMISDLLEI
jgi:hypothetical protein